MTILTGNFHDSLRSITQNHPLWNHLFLQRCRNSELSLQEIRILAVQMYNFCKNFNRILASILSCCPDENAQIVILENLYDEMGQGNLNKSHPELFRRFTRALGMDDETLAAQIVTPETRTLINTYLQIPHKYGYLAAVAAVCYASEGIVSSLYSQLYKGINDAASLSKDSLIFFELHIDIDDSHAANLAAVIESTILTPEAENNIKQAITEVMDARLQFFHGIERQISDTQLSINPLCLVNT
ncbi:MAG: iron-containing redox enzyme family protein [Nostocaceae cyanobacterium]|nr:iron-containing redox enzyme family protein [Nostocaceae cyanobacterium]